jgi:hypothetical protein
MPEGKCSIQKLKEANDASVKTLQLGKLEALLEQAEWLVPYIIRVEVANGHDFFNLGNANLQNQNKIDQVIFNPLGQVPERGGQIKKKERMVLHCQYPRDRPPPKERLLPLRHNYHHNCLLAAVLPPHTNQPTNPTNQSINQPPFPAFAQSGLKFRAVERKTRLPLASAFHALIME